ncbi:MAG: response regulator transcription factor [Oscillospiraceae bacterium]|jgi:two-component system response regulator VanR|nr:response regulator transcription factor [Oscillospiraceae bacterium]
MGIEVLIVEDDESLSDIVKKFLIKEGYSVDVCADGDVALEQMYNKNYHLLVLDIMLPGVNGHELLKEYRKISNSPVLMMTALDDDENEIRAFDNEADDYITKPFSMQVFLKHVEALLRRCGFLKKEIRVGNLIIYTEYYKAQYAGTDLTLPLKEYEILLLLAQNSGKVITHETLLTRIWGFDFDGNEGIVHATMKRLRDKLPVNLIKTVKGVGYCLEDSK